MTAAAQEVNSGTDVDGVLNVQLTDTQGTALFGAVAVTDANGHVHKDHVRDSGGWIVFTDLPYGAATVVNTQTADGYYQAPAQEAVITENGVTTVRMVSEPVVTMAMQSEDDGSNSEPLTEPTVEPTEEPTEVPTEEPTTPPTEEPTDVPTEEPTTAPTEVPIEEATEEASSTPEDGDSEDEKSDAAKREIAPLQEGGFLDGTFTCVPRGVDQPSDGTLTIPFDEQPETAPTVTIIRTDRWGEETIDSPPVTLTWDEGQSAYVASVSDDPSIWIDFVIDLEGYTTNTVGGQCSSYNPIPLEITTIAMTESGVVIPPGGPVASTTSFYDTAEFAGDHLDKINGEVTYNLYKNNGTCGGDPVWSTTATVTAGVIDNSPLFDPVATGLGDGTYDWQVVYAGNVTPPDEHGYKGNFLPASSECGSETVVVGTADSTISTVMQSCHRAEWLGADRHGGPRHGNSRPSR